MRRRPPPEVWSLPDAAVRLDRTERQLLNEDRPVRLTPARCAGRIAPADSLAGLAGRLGPQPERPCLVVETRM
jgi:hypothetical protein